VHKVKHILLIEQVFCICHSKVNEENCTAATLIMRII
jgi:hypothetical protein